MALSIATAYGLNDTAADASAGALWRARALTSRKTMPVTQYTAAFNGQPSRVNLIHIPVPTLPPAQIEAIDACVATLSRQGSAETMACGETAEADAARRVAWNLARR